MPPTTPSPGRSEYLAGRGFATQHRRFYPRADGRHSRPTAPAPPRLQALLPQIGLPPPPGARITSLGEGLLPNIAGSILAPMAATPVPPPPPRRGFKHFFLRSDSPPPRALGLPRWERVCSPTSPVLSSRRWPPLPSHRPRPAAASSTSS